LSLLPSEQLVPLALLPVGQPLARLPRDPQTETLQARAVSERNRNDRRLNAALRFLLSQDQTALETLLQASRFEEPQPEVQGQIIDFDRL
ncbi:MAG: hypothetical protein ACO3NK_05900, partial [Prochlorotrichaceae cyanobacterium]